MLDHAKVGQTGLKVRLDGGVYSSMFLILDTHSARTLPKAVIVKIRSLESLMVPFLLLSWRELVYTSCY